MCTIESRILKSGGGFFAALCAAVALCVGGASTASAQVPPANDNLTNAQPIVGLPGTINGSNVNATSETNEPAPVPGNPAQASIWYLSTAPSTTTVDFNTRGSVDPNTGNDLDTVLAVYQLPTGSNLAFSNLIQIASNDDDPSGGVVSRVDVPVTNGDVYLIQVDGSTNTPSGSNAEGIVVLNWLPSLVGGNFGFSASTYFAGEFDDEILVDWSSNPVDPSLANKSGTNNVRITVTRQGGSVGKCQVTLTVTNANYFNFFRTNYTGTNIFMTNYSTNNNMVLNFTNSYFTNVASENQFENFIDAQGTGQFVENLAWNVYQITYTNTSAGAGLIHTNVVPIPTGLTNFFTNFFCANLFLTNTVTNDATITVTITQLFCSNYFTNYIVPTATVGVDYAAPLVTNITFNDFQQSADIYLQINPKNTILTGPDYPDTNGNFNYFGISSLVQLGVTNIVMDPDEDLDIVPATNSANNSTAILDILNLGGNPNNYTGSPFALTTNGPIENYGSINLERATFRVNRTSSMAYFYVYLFGPHSGTATYQCHFTIDSADVRLGSGVFGTPPVDGFDDNRFNTVADSDYAQPSFWGVNNGADFGTPLNAPPDPAGSPVQNVGKNTTFPAETSYVGSFSFQPLDGPYALIAVPITNNDAVQFDMDYNLQLYLSADDAMNNESATGAGGAPAPVYLGSITSANVTVNFSGAVPGGANDGSFNPDGATSSYPPNNPVPGANGGVVKAVAIQPNGQSVIGGYFSSYNTTPIYGVARLTTTGYLDTTFNNVALPGVNFGGYVNAVAIDNSASPNRILVGGSFQSYDGASSINIARLANTGLLDSTFVTGVGFNGAVNALAVDANGNVLVGGDFTSYNTTNCNHIARLLPTGGLDPAFLPNTGNGLATIGTDKTVRALALDANGNIVIGGDFQMVNGTNLPYVARLLTNGTVDPTFNPEIGPDDSIYAVAVETNNNNEIIIGGAFQNFNLSSRSGIALLGANGSLDTTFNPGTGADGTIYSLAYQPANQDVIVGGQFDSVNGTRRLSVARLLPQGWIDTSFLDTAYNQFAGLYNKRHSEPLSIAYALALQADGNIVVGGSFTNVGGGGSRDVIHSKLNVARLIGAPNPGPQTGGGGIGNEPGNITFTQNPYTVDDTAGGLYVTIQRENGSLGPAQVTLGTNTFTPGPGSATAADFGLKLPDIALYDEVYNHWITSPYGNYDWRQSDGYYGQNINIQPPLSDNGLSALNLVVHNDTAALQNLFAGLSLLNVNAQDLMQLGGVSIPLSPALGVPGANLEIINDNFPPGFVGFAQTNFIAIDTSNSVTISVLRTNGSFGPINVFYYTANGTAISGVNYTGSPTPTSKTELVFNGGTGPNANIATFTIPITPQSTVQNTKSFKIFLANPNPTGVFDTNIPPVLPTNATVTIIDGNFQAGHLAFTSPTYSTLKGGVATVGVERIGGALGQLMVQVGTSNGTGTNGLNYSGATNTLVWTNQDASIKTFSFQTLQDNTVEGPKTVNVSLFGATNIGNTSSNNLILTSPSNAAVTILDSDAFGGLSFAVPDFNILQNAGQALITVIRTNGTTGTVSVNYTTLNDSNAVLPYVPAQAGTNYGPTNGTLACSSIAEAASVEPCSAR